MSPEMLSAWYLDTVTFPSQMCIDAYGLELVAMHLFGAICQSRASNVDIFCEEARKFGPICDRMHYRYKIEGRKALDDGIRERSESIKKVIQNLGYAIDKQPFDRLMNRQVSLINILSSHLIRVPLNSAEKDITWLRSAPSQCITWNEWRSAVESI